MLSLILSHMPWLEQSLRGYHLVNYLEHCQTDFTISKNVENCKIMVPFISDVRRRFWWTLFNAIWNTCIQRFDWNAHCHDVVKIAWSDHIMWLEFCMTFGWKMNRYYVPYCSIIIWKCLLFFFYVGVNICLQKTIIIHLMTVCKVKPKPVNFCIRGNFIIVFCNCILYIHFCSKINLEISVQIFVGGIV